MSSELRRRRGAGGAGPQPDDSSTSKAKVGDGIAAQHGGSSTDSSDYHGLIFPVAFAGLALVRALGTTCMGMITDCDETFNYWEPTHYLLYGRGLQTWEYAPQYALRSYAYTGVHALIGLVCGAAWGADKITVFHRTRMVLAMACALCETVFYHGVARRFGGRIGMFTYAALALSAGMLHAAPAYLPSSWTMYGLLLCWGFWLGGHLTSALVSGVVGLAMGWPFALAAIVPMGVHMLFTHNIFKIAFVGCASTAAVLGFGAVIDYFFYGKWLIAPWNIIKYNALGEGGGGQGSNLYGVEPASYFAFNLLLNFNVLAVLAALSPFAVLFVCLVKGGNRSEPSPSIWWSLSALGQLWLWFGLMSSRPHKEERFFFVAYPLMCLAAAFTIEALTRVIATIPLPGVIGKSGVRRFCQVAAVSSIFCVAGGLSAARIGALRNGYGAPFQAWTSLGRHLQAPSTSPDAPALPQSALPLTAYPQFDIPGLPPFSTQAVGAVLPGSRPGVRVCVGKEWYRFPAAYFLPERTRDHAAAFPLGRPHTENGPAEIAFIRSNFSGLLPQLYLPLNANGTSVARDGFNDENREEPDRYVPVQTCDYIVDLQLPPGRTSQPEYEPHFAAMFHSDADRCECYGSSTVRWHSLLQIPFLDAESTPSLARAFWIPGYSDKRAKWATYHVLQKLDCCQMRSEGAEAE